jgi:hypothetical protein
MSEPFLTTTVPNMRIAVEVAWGADLTDLTGASWTWDDITADVILERGGGSGGGSGRGGGGDSAGGSISITLGRPDFSQETQTAEMVCQLDNRDGAYSEGGMSPHWPYVRRNTPVRVRVSDDGGASWYTRFQGAANGFTPAWDPETGRWAIVTLSASGPLRRLNQGTLPAKSVYTTEIPRSSGWNGMFLYWPGEGGDGRKSLPAVVPATGHPVMQLFDVYPPKVANNPSNAAFPLSGPMQSSFAMFTGQGLLDQADGTPGEQVPSYTDTGILQFRFMLAVPGAYPTPQNQNILQIRTGNTTVRRWNLQINEAGQLRIVGTNDAGDIIRTGSFVSFGMNGQARLVSVTLDNNGSSLDATIRTLDQLGDGLTWTETFSSSNIGTLNGVYLNGTDFSDDGTGTSNGLIAHVSVQNTTTSISAAAVEEVFLGLPGETVTARLTRLCANHGFALDVLDSAATSSASITDTMGAQYYDTLTNLLRECERTGQGVLYDGLGPGLTYVTKKRREANASGPAALVLDASGAQLMEPFAPIDDDQLTINHCDVTQRNGATAAWIDEDGPVGADAIGDYATSYEVCVEDDNDLVSYAQWTVGIGTQQGYRYPSVSFALETNPDLIAGWLACTPQSRIDVENVTAIRRQHPAETINLLLEGWHEEIDAFTWRVTANTSPAAPWNVITLAAATGSTGDGVCHMDTDSSQLNANAAQGATSISVRTNSGPRWVATSEDADSFPFDIDLGGIKATVTAISGTTSPQTFTLAEGLPRDFTGSTTTGAGTPIKVWRPPVLGL